jgi:hypothetical protein
MGLVTHQPFWSVQPVSEPEMVAGGRSYSIVS